LRAFQIRRIAHIWVFKYNSFMHFS
jgi:hypothetical protein